MTRVPLVLLLFFALAFSGGVHCAPSTTEEDSIANEESTSPTTTGSVASELEREAPEFAPFVVANENEVVAGEREESTDDDAGEELVKSDEACFECQSVAHFIQVELYDYNKEKVIDDWVMNNFCEKIGSVIGKQTCDSFVQEYGASIIQLIAMKAFDPKVLCEKTLKLCPPSMDREELTTPSGVESGPGVFLQRPNPKFDIELLRAKADKCDICINAVKTIDGLLTTGIIDQEIAKVATKVCNHVDVKQKQQCIEIVETFLPFILQSIGRLNNPRQVCKEIDLCYQIGQVHLLGGHKCSFGPTYWCHTAAHADACKATDFCKRKVWTAIE